MKKLDRFILKSFIGPFMAILAVVLFILMMQFLWLYIDELVGKGLGLGVILEFIMWGACITMPLALPLATLLASMMTLGQMGENFELIAIKASGVSLARIMAPLMICSFIISIGAFFTGNDLVPKAYNEIFTLRDDIGRTKSEIKIPAGTFYEGIEGYILRVESQDRKTKMMRKVMVYDHTGGKGNTTITLADSAMLKMSRKKDYLIFDLFSGANFQEDNVMKYKDTTLQLQRLGFDSQELIIPLRNYSFEKSDTNRFGNQVKAMSLAQLQHEQDTLHTQLDAVKARQMRPILLCTDLQFSRQLDTSKVDRQAQLFPYDSLSHWSDISEKIQALSDASAIMERIRGEVISYDRDVYQYTFILKHADLEALHKFAAALACFILFFIGAPLGALIKKGGLGTSAIVSALFFVLYWVVDISGTKLAKDGAIDAATGSFISTYVLAPIGLFLCWKAINDQQLFNFDNIKNWRKAMLSKIKNFIRPTRIVFMGTPEFAVSSLDALIQNGFKVVGVVTVPDKPSGRGLKVNSSAVKQYAQEHGLPVLQPVRMKDPDFISALKAWKPDLFAVVAFRMLPEEVYTIPKLGTFNLHAALLPQYRGAAPINWALINGERITGVTTFFIDKGVDTGGIIFREECRIAPDETAGQLHDHLAEIGSALVVQTVDAIIQKNVEIRVQRSFIQGSEVLHPAPKLTRELCDVDWTWPTDRVYNLIRGLSPYPAAFTTLLPVSSAAAGPASAAAPELSPETVATLGNVRGGTAGEAGGGVERSETFPGASSGAAQTAGLQLKIYGALKRSDLHAVPGTVLSDGKSYLAIATSDGAIEITELQLQGKKRMDVRAFLAGFRDPESYVAASC